MAGAVVIWVLLAAGPARAATTWTVTNAGDGVSTCPSASSCTLRGAVASASAGDTILLPAGTYTLTSSKGTIEIAKSLTITGAGSTKTPGAAGTTTITESASPGVTLFDVDEGASVTLSALTLYEATAASSGTEGGYGGAIYNAGSLALSNDVLLDDGAAGASANGATSGGGGYGGAIYNNGTLTASGTAFQGDTVGGGAGGTSYAGGEGQGGAIYNDGVAVLSTCSFDGDQASAGKAGNGESGNGGDGGAIFNAGGTLTAQSSTFGAGSANTAFGSLNAGATGGQGGQGGAIDSVARIALVNDSFTLNIAGGGTVGTTTGWSTDGDGGALALEYDAATITGGSFTVTSGGSPSGNVAQGGIGISGGTYGAGGAGGAILADDERLVISGTTFNGASATGGAGSATSGGEGGSGGALYIADADVTISGATFTGDTATHGADGSTSGDGAGAAGGAIYFDNGSLDVSGSTFTGNSATASTRTGAYGASGGALYGEGGAITISSSTFNSNTAAAGGTGGGGGNGGAAFFSDGPATLSTDSITGNSAAAGFGGGVDASYGAAVRLVQSTVSGNGAAFGAGAYGEQDLAIVNSTIAANTATSGGGGIFEDGTLLLDNATIDANTAAQYGGNLYDEHGLFEPHDSLIVGGVVTGATGSGNQNCFLDSPQGVLSQGYNLEDRDQCGFNATGDLVNEASPDLGALASNGGPTQTIALLSGSPAIDAGDPAGCTDEYAAPLTTDQRGDSRPSGSRCDIGAYEYQWPAPTPPSTSTSTSTTSTSTPQPSATAPALTGLAVSPPAFAAKTSKHHKKVGASIGYSDTEAALTTFTVIELANGYRKHGGACKALHGKLPKGSKSCALHVTIGTFTHQDVAGSNTVHLSGTVNGRTLATGSYVLDAQPTLSGLTGATVTATFKVS